MRTFKIVCCGAAVGLALGASPSVAALSLTGHSFLIDADVPDPLGGLIDNSFFHAHFNWLTVHGWLDPGQEFENVSYSIQIPQSPTRIDFLVVGIVPIPFLAALPNLAYGVVFRSGDQWYMTGYGLIWAPGSGRQWTYSFEGVLVEPDSATPADLP